jgi:FkbM family methyltransferase
MSRRLLEAAKTVLRLLVLDRKSIAIVMWRLRRGDSTLRLHYDLGPESLVFDVGGYRGEFVEQVTARFDCRVHVFEPVPQYCAEIREKLGGNPKVTINCVGLSDTTRTETISVDGAASSVVKQAGERTEIRLVDIGEYLAPMGRPRIDLIKINIEGAEYALLERMHELGLIERCRDIQIQFHDFVGDAEARRDKLRRMLAATHDLTYDYYFIWENWHLRSSAE